MTKISIYYVLRLKNTDKLFVINDTSGLPFEERFIGSMEDCTIFGTLDGVNDYLDACERWESRQLKDKIEILKIEKTETFKFLPLD
jgi:hypothetical protein